ncbi:cysteine synthase family protein [uncultured Paludibaculum sp.]|uniref:PLP-dependent cysteine synthase family protein n=1 Tax=uncultured Paludibaculum sp. TaxID=1765020 RepID=UPI002AAB846F|nr:cysteine synthase family protein [uncultured Paludibaculum sp.]
MKLPQLNAYLHLLGPTPLAPIRLEDEGPVVWCKLEFLNPSGSTKDRIARHILTKAWREGHIRPGSVVLEASSGSTSIAMALVSAQFGMRFIAVMPEGVSNERVLMIRALGGEIRLTPKELGIRGSIAETERLAAECHGFLPCQFSNPENATAHAQATAREVLDQIPGGQVDAVVSGVGTGGTLLGLYQGIRESGCEPIPVHARPVDLGSTPEVECCSFSSRIPGVLDCVSQIFRPEELPGLQVIEVRDKDALATTRNLMRHGFPVGASSGLNYAAAAEMARRLGPTAQVVTVLPDRMERYFTTEVFEPMRCAN